MNEELLLELEALQSIYGGNFSLKPPVWNQPCFSIKVKPLIFEKDEIATSVTGLE